MKTELLAPAGSYEALTAALAAGADAVYLGGAAFGARAYAKNLTEEEILRAIDFVHLHGKKLYLTVNTLFKEEELEEQLYEYLLPYYRQGLDAVIVQDLGALRAIRRWFPDLAVHASTQMTVTGSAAARMLEQQGVSRVVPARELSLAEIQKIHKTNEQKAFCDLVDDRKEKPYSTLLIADRGYASWNNLAHVVQKQQYFLIRIKDGYGGIKRGLNLPSEDEYDCFFEINLCRGQTNEDKKRYEDKNHYKFLPVGVRFDFLPKKRQKNKPSQQYKINFRVVRFKIGDGSYESVLTNLPQAKYSITTIKYLYNKRWGIETAYRSLKYTVGLSHLHCKSITGILAKVIIYNLAQSLISEIVVSKKSNNKYLYKPNFSVAIHQEILLLRGETKLKLVIRTISKDLIPIRPNRSFKRNKQVRRFKGFHYRAG